MRHVISSIFKAVDGARTSAVRVGKGTALQAHSSTMTLLAADQLRFISGGDDATIDGLPKGGWKTTTTTA